MKRLIQIFINYLCSGYSIWEAKYRCQWGPWQLTLSISVLWNNYIQNMKSSHEELQEGSKCQKINTKTNIDRKLTKITRHGRDPSQIKIWISLIQSPALIHEQMCSHYPICSLAVLSLSSLSSGAVREEPLSNLNNNDKEPEILLKTKNQKWGLGFPACALFPSPTPAVSPSTASFPPHSPTRETLSLPLTLFSSWPWSAQSISW